MVNMRNIIVEDLHSTPVSEHKVEVVERKGIGHPDYICDAIMNEVSNNLSKEYLKRFGAVMHHNIDKGLLAAGEAQQKFGGGRVIYPMLLIFGDRATFEEGGQTVPVSDIAIKTAKDWFRRNLRFVDPDRHLKYQIELRKGSAALNDIFKRKTDMFGANDTSATVGYAPLTQTEIIVMETENFLNSKQFKKRFPESSEDIKVMALRTNNDLHLTVAMPLVDRFVESEQDYFRKKEVILEEIKNFVKNKTDLKTEVFINTLDVKGRGLGGIYMTVTGTCAEDADSGEVGRGNRVNGLIPLNRPVSNEAAAGKNPVSHVGKIYNVLSHKIANEVYNNVSGIKEIYIWLLSQIGRPIDHPDVAAAQVIMNSGSVNSIRKEVHEVIDKELANINQFCMDLINGKYKVC
jgi:S-adenosylmethionine synthetase